MTSSLFRLISKLEEKIHLLMMITKSELLDSLDIDNDNDIIKINGIILISCEFVPNLDLRFKVISQNVFSISGSISWG